jgi:hypothetical protein
MGIATIGDEILCCDASTGSLRVIDPRAEAVHSMIAGELLRSGDALGPVARAALAQPRGVAAAGDGAVFVADSWNDRVVCIDPRRTHVTKVDTPPLVLPEGVAVVERTLFVADTGNDRVLAVELDTGTWREVLGPASDLPPVGCGAVPAPPALRTGARVAIRVLLPIPDRERLRSDARLVRARLAQREGQAFVDVPAELVLQPAQDHVVIDVLRTLDAGSAALTVELEYSTARTDDTVGHAQRVSVEAHVTLAAAGETELALAPP